MQGNGGASPIPQFGTSLIQINAPNAPTNYNLQIPPPPHLFRREGEGSALVGASKHIFDVKGRAEPSALCQNRHDLEASTLCVTLISVFDGTMRAARKTTTRQR